MRFVNHIIFATCLVVLCQCCGCKDKDEIPPDITILSPSEGTIYSVFDTVFTSFEVADESQLVEVTAELVNSNFAPITAKTNIPNFSGSASLVIDNKLLETGDYYILVTAKDGTNESREFRKIKIVAIPKDRRAVYVATSSGSGQDAIWKVDSLFQQANLWAQPGQDILKLCVNSRTDQVSIVGNLSKGLKTYSISSNSVQWSVDVFPVSQTPRYMDLICHENTVFTTIYDREIRSYSEFGSQTLGIFTEEYRPEEIYTDGQYILVDMNLVGDSRNMLNVYNYFSRALIWQTDFLVDIVSICQLQGDEVLVFGNANGQAKVFEYDISLNTWWEPRQLPQGNVLKAIATEGNRFALLHENGIYSYTYAPNFLNLISSGSFQDINFDVDNGIILGASGNVLQQLTEGGQQVGSISLNDPIVSFDIHYTR